MVTATGKFAEQVSESMNQIQMQNQMIGEQMGMHRGVIETSVGWVTEFFAKPARQKAVNDYIDGTLLPELRVELMNLGNTLLRDISTLINNEAQIASDALRNNLEEMKSAFMEKKEEYNRIQEMYKTYSKQLKQYIA